MKTLVTFTFLLITFVAQAQIGTYAWFKKDRIPYYRDRDRNFDSYKMQGGVEQNGFMPGYYIDKNDQKIEGEVQYNFPFIMERILVFRANGNTTFIQPRDIKGYFIDGLYRESVTLNVSMIGGLKKLETYFMFPEIKGKLSLYFYSGENPTDLEGDEDLSKWNNYYSAYQVYLKKQESEIQKRTPKTQYLQKQGEPAIGVDAMALTFANKMSTLIEDCATVANKVKGKEKGYRSSDLEKIIAEYNELCEK